MSGDSFLRVWVHACPDEQLAGAAEALAGHYVEAEYENEPPLDGGLVLGQRYIRAECYADAAADLAGDLLAKAPGASWLLWADPEGSDLGDLHAYTPELGPYRADCGAGGDVLFTLDDVRRVLARGGDFAAAMGEPWLDALNPGTADGEGP